MKFWWVVTLCVLIIAAGDTALARSENVNAQDFGDKWPLTVSEGILECKRPSRVIFRSKGNAYAVNGMAGSAGYANIRPIWRNNPDIPGTKINIGPLIRRGLTLC